MQIREPPTWRSIVYNVDIKTGELLTKKKLINYRKIKTNKHVEHSIRTVTYTNEWRISEQGKLFTDNK